MKEQVLLLRSKILLLSLALMQVLDGALTYMGVSKYGTLAEGNPLMKYLMDQIGIVPTLVGVKLIAILLIYMWWKLKLCKQGALALRVLYFLNVVYLFVVGSWIYVFTFLEHI